MRAISLLALSLVLCACSPQWVKPTAEGETVAILQEKDVVNCRPVTSITVSVLSKVLINRDPEKVKEELRTLARNKAANSGDSIVASSPVNNGEQTFDIYRCRR